MLLAKYICQLIEHILCILFQFEIKLCSYMLSFVQACSNTPLAFVFHHIVCYRVLQQQTDMEIFNVFMRHVMTFQMLKVVFIQMHTHLSMRTSVLLTVLATEAHLVQSQAQKLQQLNS